MSGSLDSTDGALLKSPKMSFLKSVSLFHSLQEDQLLELCKRLVVVTFPPNTPIVVQDDAGDEFFLIQSGKVRGWLL